MTQPDGAYPRLNGAMLLSGKYTDMIVSLVGRFQSPNMDDTGVIEFQAADGTICAINLSDVELPACLDLPLEARPVVELVGCPDSNGALNLFVTRELSVDTDLELYNKMLEVQNNPKYGSYFQTGSGDAVMGQ